MTSPRFPDFQLFLSLSEAAIRQRLDVDTPVRVAAERMVSALHVPSTRADHLAPVRLPVCRYLPMALERVRQEPGPIGELAKAFAAIEPLLTWTIRAGAEPHDEQFLNNHANAIIAGPEGLEIRRDVRIGVSLMGPHTQYPDHRHPPEEIYIVLSSGQWRQEKNPWHEPGIGGLVYNPSSVLHAMRSTEQPLLALWFLWTGDTNS